MVSRAFCSSLSLCFITGQTGALAPPRHDDVKRSGYLLDLRLLNSRPVSYSCSKMPGFLFSQLTARIRVPFHERASRGVRRDAMIGDTEYYVQGVTQRRSELASSAWLSKFWALLDPFVVDGITEIRCLALGLICDHFNPRFQLALLLLIAEHYGVAKVTVWDPAFTEQDREVLQVLGVPVVEEDPQPNVSLFWYVPHGPLKLVAELPPKIGSSVYLGNDLSQFDLDAKDSALLVEYESSAKITRVPVSKHDRWSTAFHAMAIHRREDDTV